MLKFLVPKLQLVLDDDETIIFNEVCHRPIFFHFIALFWGVVAAIWFLFLCTISPFLTFHFWSNLSHVEPSVNKMEFIYQLFISVFQKNAIEMGFLFVFAGVWVIAFLEFFLALFPLQIILTNKRIVLNTYSLNIRQHELVFHDIEEISKAKWISFRAFKIRGKNNKATTFCIPKVNNIEKIHTLLVQSQNIKTVLENHFSLPAKVSRIHILQRAIIIVGALSYIPIMLLMLHLG